MDDENIGKLVVAVATVIVLYAIVPVLHSSFCPRRPWTRRGSSPPQRAVLITGCDSGFGLRLCHRLSLIAQEGEPFTIFAGVLSLKSSGAKELMSSDFVRVLKMDVTSDDDVRACARTIRTWTEEKGRELHAVVNNAGVQCGCLVDWSSMSNYRAMIEVNYLGLVRVTKAFLPILRDRQPSSFDGAVARIVNVTSVNGVVTLPGISGYAASKHAAEAFSDSLRYELSAWCNGVRVVNVNPGTFRTPMASAAAGNLMKAYKTSPDDVRRAYGKAFATAVYSGSKRFTDMAGDPEEVVDALQHAVCSTPYPHDRYFVGTDAIWLWRPWYRYVPHIVRDRLIPLILRTILPRPRGM